MRRDPASVALLCSKGAAELGLGRWRQAQRTYARSLQLDRTSVEAVVGLGNCFFTKAVRTPQVPEHLLRLGVAIVPKFSARAPQRRMAARPGEIPALAPTWATPDAQPQPPLAAPAAPRAGSAKPASHRAGGALRARHSPHLGAATAAGAGADEPAESARAERRVSDAPGSARGPGQGEGRDEGPAPSDGIVRDELGDDDGGSASSDGSWDSEPAGIAGAAPELLDQANRKALLRAAAACYQRALLMRPTSVAARLNLAHTLLEQGRSGAAARQFTIILQLRPRHAAATEGRAWLRLQRGDVQGALADATHVVNQAVGGAPALAHRVGQCLANRGVIREAARDRQGAMSDYEEALRRQPNCSPAAFNLGTALLRHKRLAEAVQKLTLAIEHDPGLWAAKVNRGVAQACLGRLEEALADLDAAIDLHPHCGAAHFNRALVLRRLQRLPEVEHSLTQAAALLPVDPQVYMQRARALERSWRMADAMNDYATALMLDPSLDLR